MSFFSIEGNIKQQFLPFQLNPDAPINQMNAGGIDKSSNPENTGTIATATKISPQLFTYRNAAYVDDTSVGMLGFYPAASFPTPIGTKPEFDYPSPDKLNKDLSYQLLYSETDAVSLTINEIISKIPGISIREFLPDTRLDQCINMFKNLFSKMSEMFISAKNDPANKIKDEQFKFDRLFKKIWECAKFTIKYMTGLYPDASFVQDMLDDNTRVTLDFFSENARTNHEDLLRYVVQFPYTLYYCLQSCTTTNIYEVPAMCEGKPIMSSNGKPGWGDGSDIMGAGGFRASGMLNKIPIIGDLANMVLGNIGINYLPWWNAESGSKVAAPEINVKFDLFNDTLDRAIINFIFVNTIVPGNKWIQYNMFQHSSNLYDVKIEGLNRLFACAASFNVTYDGVLRDPPSSFIGRLVAKHLSKSVDAENIVSSIVSNRLIKIPDVYHVEMSFKSLLPANFNNFLFTYSQNTSHLVDYSNKVYDPGLGSLVGSALGKFGVRIKEVWESTNADEGAKTEALKQKERDKVSEALNEYNKHVEIDTDNMDAAAKEQYDQKMQELTQKYQRAQESAVFNRPEELPQ